MLEDHVDDPPALLDVLQFAAAEEHVDQHLVLVLQKLPGLVDLCVDVVFAGLIIFAALSLMPDGLLDKLSKEEVRDLVGYLASPQQVPLPKEQPK